MINENKAENVCTQCGRSFLNTNDNNFKRCRICRGKDRVYRENKNGHVSLNRELEKQRKLDKKANEPVSKRQKSQFILFANSTSFECSVCGCLTIIKVQKEHRTICKECERNGI